MSHPVLPANLQPPRAPQCALPRRVPRAAGVVLAGALLVVATASGSAAHVTVNPDSTTVGAWTTLTFRVPNESETAGTTALAVALPTDTPLRSVSTKPVPGWTAEVTHGDLPEPVEVDGAILTEAPLSVTWTAEPDVEIAPGEYQEFAISVGTMPAEVGTRVVFPSDQTYSDGTVVSWSEVAESDDDSPAHPAPELTTTAAAVSAGSTEGTASADVLARSLGGIAVLLAAAGLVVSLRRRSGMTS